MSKKDGKATLLNAIAKKEVFILEINQHDMHVSLEAARICPVKIIKIS
jgi:ferredoxin